MTIRPRSLTTPAAGVALTLLLLALGWATAAFAEPATITFLHTNDVYEIVPVGGQGGLAELGTLLSRSVPATRTASRPSAAT